MAGGDSLLNVNEDAQHVLVYLQAFQQRRLAVENKGGSEAWPNHTLGTGVSLPRLAIHMGTLGVKTIEDHPV